MYSIPTVKCFLSLPLLSATLWPTFEKQKLLWKQAFCTSGNLTIKQDRQPAPPPSFLFKVEMFLSFSNIFCQLVPKMKAVAIISIAFQIQSPLRPPDQSRISWTITDIQCHLFIQPCLSESKIETATFLSSYDPHPKIFCPWGFAEAKKWTILRLARVTVTSAIRRRQAATSPRGPQIETFGNGFLNQDSCLL